MTIPIVPAVIPNNETHLLEMVDVLSFSHELHLDVVDGEFVETISWPYAPQGDPASVSRYTDTFTLEVDLMVSNPITAARAWEKAGADMLVFHIETIDIAAFIDFAAHTDASIGVSFHGTTTLDDLFLYLPHADYVQVMGIYTIGKQGEPFDLVTFQKISAIHSAFPNHAISVDGSVNERTIPKLVRAGVDRLIVGSAIVGKENPLDAYHALVQCVEDAK